MDSSAHYGFNKRAAEHLQKRGSMMIAIVTILAQDIPEFGIQVYELIYGQLEIDFIRLFPILTRLFVNFHWVQLISIGVTILHFMFRVIGFWLFAFRDSFMDKRSNYRYSRFP